MYSKIIKFHQWFLQDPTLYRLNLFLNSNQWLSLFSQNQILRSKRHKTLRKQNNKDFFIQLLNAWLNFIYSNFPTPLPTPTPASIYRRNSIPPNWTSDLISHISVASYPEIFHTNLPRLEIL